MRTITAARTPRAMLAITAFAIAFAFTPLLHAHEAACAHDGGLAACMPGVGPGDTMGKGDAAALYDPATEPGEQGPAPAMSSTPGEFVQLGNYNPRTSIADVWAHKRVAYLGSWGADCRASGVEAVSLADPTNPTPLSTFADAASNPALARSWTEKVVVQRVSTRHFKGDLAAVSFQPCSANDLARGFRGFGVYDVSDPANPVELALVPTGNRHGVHELWLEVRPNAAYVYTAAIYSEFLTPQAGPDFQVWDISQPTAPMKVSEWGATAELGIPYSRDGRVSFVHSVVGDGRRAYLSYWDTGTVILDLRDPANPVYEGRTAFADHEEGNAHSAALAQGGNLLIQTDEDFSVGAPANRETAWGYPRFYDVSDRANPVQVATFELPTTRQNPAPSAGDYTVHDPKVRGNTAFFSWYREGIVAVDFAGVRNGRAPEMIAQWVTPGENPHPYRPNLRPGDGASVWGVALDGDLVLASDRNSGLYVLRLER
jgi:hypothetical protein